jgi:hypothetical protein
MVLYEEHVAHCIENNGYAYNFILRKFVFLFANERSKSVVAGRGDCRRG